MVFGGQRNNRSASDSVLPAVCTETDPRTEPTESFITHFTKYLRATAGTDSYLNDSSTPLNGAIKNSNVFVECFMAQVLYSAL